MPPRAKDPWLPLLLIHASMMASVIMYGIIGYTISEELPPAAPMSHGAFVAIMAGVAALCAVLSFVLRARLMPTSGTADEPAATRFGKLRGALIAAWALCEAVALCGLVVTFVFHDVSDYAPFGAAALVLLLVHAPRPRKLAALMR